MPLLPDRISRDCRHDYPAAHHSGERRASAIRYIVIHVTEGGSAQSTAQYFQRPDSTGSAHIVVDDLRCYLCLADTLIPWGAPPLNTHGYHIEHAGYSAWSTARWRLHEVTIRRGAYKASLRCKLYGIPPRLLSATQLRADFGALDAHGNVAHPGPLNGGIVTHKIVSDAFHLSDHHDPGDGFPLEHWLALLRGHLPRGYAGRMPLAVHS